MFLILYSKLWFLTIMITSLNAGEYVVSSGKTIVRSGDMFGYEPQKYATDNNLNTYFKVVNSENTSSNFVGGEAWMRIDLSLIFEISKVVLWTADDFEWYLSRDIKVYISTKINVSLDKMTELINPNCSNDGSAISPSRASQMVYTAAESTFGRYVWIAASRNGTLYLAEVAVLTEDDSYQIESGNLDITQSHVFNNDSTYNASKGDDDDLTTCIKTDNQIVGNVNDFGWVKVDLRAVYKIKKLRISIGVYPDQYHGYFSVYVEKTGPSDRQFCSSFNQVTDADNKYPYYTLTCVSQVQGRYVVIVKNYNVQDPQIDALNICEIEILPSYQAQPYVNPINYNIKFDLKISSLRECESEKSWFEKWSKIGEPIIAIVGSIISGLTGLCYGKKKKVPTATLR